MTTCSITPFDAFQNRDRQLFLDVRTQAEFDEAHIQGAVLHPLSDLDIVRVRSLAEGKESCVLVCRSGSRAQQAARKLMDSGLSSVAVLEGGIMRWKSEGLPLNEGRRHISLERQVRIAAGLFVLAGSLLTYLVSMAWIALPMFVGAGLVFAGVTDTCGMAAVLGRMPWNSRPSSGQACQFVKRS